MMRRVLALVAVLAMMAGAAHAQTKKELVQKVLQLQQAGVENVGRVLAAQTATQMMQMAGQQLGRVPADKRDAIVKDIQGDVRKFHDEVEPLLRKRAAELASSTIGATLEERFTEEELKQVVTWLESPVVKKYSQLASELETSLAQKLVADTRPTIEPKLKALEQTISKRLGMPPRPASAPAPAKK